MKENPHPGTFRLLSYNIHGCIGKGGHYDARKILRVLRELNADLVALQEVYDEEPEDRQFLRDLKQLYPREIVYGITFQHQPRGSYGNVLLSKWPLQGVEKIDLSITPHEPRGAIHAEAVFPSGTLDITATHLGLKRRERALQVAKLMDYLPSGKGAKEERKPCCLMGDLNEWYSGSRLLRHLRQTIAASPAQPTFPSNFPVFALDHILVRPASLVVNHFVHNTGLTRRASDHLPVVADIQFQKRPPHRGQRIAPSQKA